MRLLLDTSVIISGAELPGGFESTISAVSISELHYGLLVAPDDAERAIRANRLGLLEARFPSPLPIDSGVAREWASLQAAVTKRGRKAYRRNADLAIAATANVNQAVLVTHNAKDFEV